MLYNVHVSKFQVTAVNATRTKKSCFSRVKSQQQQHNNIHIYIITTSGMKQAQKK